MNSIFHQTYAPSKIIVVNTSKELETISSKSNYIESLNRPSLELINLPGRSNNYGRNCGASSFESDYIAFLDDDDEWHPQKLENQIKIIDDDVSIIYSNYMIEDKKGDLSPRFDGFPIGEELKVEIIGENVIGCTSMPLLSHKVFHETGGLDKSLESNQEWDLWIRILQNHDAIYCPEIAGIKHYSTEGISNSGRKRATGWIRLLMKHAKKYRRNPKQFAIATGFFSGEMFDKKMYLTGISTFLIHMLFKIIYMKD